MIMLPVESCRAAIGVCYFRHGKHVHKRKKNNCTSKFLAKIKETNVSSKLFLCSVIMIMVYLNLHDRSVMVRNLTSEGNGSNPGPSHFAVKT